MMLVNAYGEHIGGTKPWQIEVIERLVDKGVLRYCDVCGRPFKPKCDTQRYCQFQCRQEANRYRARQRARRIAQTRREMQGIELLTAEVEDLLMNELIRADLSHENHETV